MSRYRVSNALHVTVTHFVSKILPLHCNVTYRLSLAVTTQGGIYTPCVTVTCNGHYLHPIKKGETRTIPSGQDNQE